MFKKGCFELGATIYPVVIKVSDNMAPIMQFISGSNESPGGPFPSVGSAWEGGKHNPR